MGVILIENHEPNEPRSRFDGPTTIAHKLAEETKRLTREAVRRYRSKFPESGVRNAPEVATALARGIWATPEDRQAKRTMLRLRRDCSITRNGRRAIQSTQECTS